MTTHADKMMDEFDVWLIRIGKALAVILLLALYLLAIAWWMEPPPQRRVVVQPTQAERRWIEERHRYHGIDVSIYEDGQYYFERDGKRCKL